MENSHRSSDSLWRSDVLQWCFLLLLCSAYLQGGIEKAIDFGAAQAEMRARRLARA